MTVQTMKVMTPFLLHEDPKKILGNVIDHSAKKIKLLCTIGCDDGSTRQHFFEVRPCEVFKVESQEKKVAGIKKHHASTHTTIPSVDQLNKKMWNFTKYNYRINSEKWIEPKAVITPRVTNVSQPSAPENHEKEPEEEEVSNLVQKEFGASPPNNDTSGQNIINRKADGSLPTTRCHKCKRLPTSHYCVNPKKGSNTFFSNDTELEICRTAHCLQCRNENGDVSGEYMNYCNVCSAEIKLKEKKYKEEGK